MRMPALKRGAGVIDTFPDGYTPLWLAILFVIIFIVGLVYLAKKHDSHS